jgi:hypothetical protein
MSHHRFMRTMLRTVVVLAIASALWACGGGGGGVPQGYRESFVAPAAGGTVTLRSGAIQLEFPAGAVASDTAMEAFSPSALPSDSGVILSTAVSFTNAPLSKPVTLRLSYSASDAPTDPLNDLTIVRLSGSVWVPVEGATVNPQGRTISASADSFGTFAIRRTVRSKWTVMVFLNAANDLYRFSDLNMNQMETVASNPDVRFVVQWKQSTSLFPTSSFNGTRRYLVQPDNTDQIRSQLLADMGQSVDMGKAQTMREFASWAKDAYPAERYALIIWNHGNGWLRSASAETSRAVSYDDQTGNAIQIYELGPALAGLGLDILAFDASLMQMTEVAYEVRDHVPFVVGSQESPPGEGYPYDLVFRRFRDNPTAPTRNLTKAFVDGMLENPIYVNRKITQSVVESSKMPAVAQAADNLAKLLIQNKAAIGEQVVAARSATQAYSPTSFRRFFDLVDFCRNLESRVAVPEIVTAAQQVRAAVGQAVIHEGHNAQSPRSNGLAIDLSEGSAFAATKSGYMPLQWAKDTAWADWLLIAP